MAIDKATLPSELHAAVAALESVAANTGSEQTRKTAQRMLDAAECDFPALDAEESSEPLCTVSWFTAGGRSEATCKEVAQHICADCGEGRCDEHSEGDHALAYWQRADGAVLCEECLGDDTEGATALD